MALERRSSLRKADTPDDALAGMATTPPAVGAPSPSVPTPIPGVLDETPAPARRGPGRPRTRPVRVGFTSKIDLEVRERLDAWEYETGERIVDLLDRALRAAMSMPPGESRR